MRDKTCTCHAYMAGECVCGAWDDASDTVTAKAIAATERAFTKQIEALGKRIYELVAEKETITTALATANAEVERMRAVYEAALEWATSTRTYKPDGCDDALNYMLEQAQTAFNKALAEEAAIDSAIGGENGAVPSVCDCTPNAHGHLSYCPARRA